MYDHFVGLRGATHLKWCSGQNTVGSFEIERGHVFLGPPPTLFIIQKRPENRRNPVSMSFAILRFHFDFPINGV